MEKRSTSDLSMGWRENMFSSNAVMDLKLQNMPSFEENVRKRLIKEKNMIYDVIQDHN